MNALPPHRDLDHAVQLAQGAGVRIRRHTIGLIPSSHTLICKTPDASGTDGSTSMDGLRGFDGRDTSQPYRDRLYSVAPHFLMLPCSGPYRKFSHGCCQWAIWFYADLKAYRLDPTPRRRCEMRSRFDRIFHGHTGFATLDRLLKRLHANKAGLLRVLDHSEITPHTNGLENGIRCQVTKCAVSGAHAATPDAIAATPS